MNRTSGIATANREANSTEYSHGQVGSRGT